MPAPLLPEPESACSWRAATACWPSVSSDGRADVDCVRAPAWNSRAAAGRAAMGGPDARPRAHLHMAGLWLVVPYAGLRPLGFWSADRGPIAVAPGAVTTGIGFSLRRDVPPPAPDGLRASVELVVNAQGSAPPAAPPFVSGWMSGSRLTLTWTPPFVSGVATSYLVEAGAATGATSLTPPASVRRRRKCGCRSATWRRRRTPGRTCRPRPRAAP